MSLFRRELEVALSAVREAGAVAQRYFGKQLQVDDKPDGQGPVSEADRACDALLRNRLSSAFPDDALLTEESTDDGAWRTAERVWMVDPIDGTQEFIEGVNMYAIMVGLCIDGMPALGAVYAPAQALLMCGVVGDGARIVRRGEERELRVASAREDGVWRVAVSRSHPSSKVDRVCAELGRVEQKKIGSVGLKIAAVAQDEADFYLAGTGKIKLWDTCGPHAVLSAAGGSLVDLFGHPLDYRETIAHEHGLLASPDAFLSELVPVTRPLAAEFFGNTSA